MSVLMNLRMFEIVISKKVVRKIKGLNIYSGKIIKVIESLNYNPLPIEKYKVEKLKGFKNLYRIRVGKIRIIYTIDFKRKIIKIEEVNFRGKVYKKF